MKWRNKRRTNETSFRTRWFLHATRRNPGWYWRCDQVKNLINTTWLFKFFIIHFTNRRLNELISVYQNKIKNKSISFGEESTSTSNQVNSTSSSTSSSSTINKLFQFGSLTNKLYSLTRKNWFQNFVRTFFKQNKAYFLFIYSKKNASSSNKMI
jgi:hypothetical protein